MRFGMSPPKVSSLRHPEEAEGKSNLRGFHRRKLPLPVELVTISGDAITGKSVDLGLGGMRFVATGPLSPGTDAIANLEFGTGAKIQTAVQVVWKQLVEGSDHYGVRFVDFNSEDRFAIMDVVFAPPEDWPLDALFDAVEASTDKDFSRTSRPLSPAHHHYYMRLIRRLEQVHKVGPAAIDRLLFAVLQQGREFAGALLSLNLTTYDQLDEYLGSLYGIPYANLSAIKPDAGIAELIPESIAVSQNIVPIKRVDGKYIVAMADPLDLPARDIIQLRTKDQVELRFSFVGEVEKAVKSVYQAASLQAADRLIDRASAAERSIELYKTVPEVTDLETLRRLSDATPIISLVDSLLRSAVEDRASDIHLEPMEDAIIVRFRLDGVLHEVRTLPRNLLASVVSRIKIMAGMDITERHIPLDGRISMRYGGKDFELRVSSLPTVFGEKIVVRLLEKNPMFKTMRSVGFSE